MKVRRRVGFGAVVALVAAASVPAGAQGSAAEEAQRTAAIGLAQVLGDCNGESVTLTGTQERGENALPIDGRVRTLTIDLSGWDQHTSFRATGEVRAWASRSGWGTRRATVRATLAATTTPTAERRCGASLESTTRTSLEVTTTKRSWLVAASTLAGPLDGMVSVSRNGTIVVHLPLGQRTTRLLAAGAHRVRIDGSARVEEAATGGGATESGSFSASVELVPVGTRRSLTGTGTGYLTVGHRDCSLNRVRASFTDAGRSKVSRATFFVNGTRRLVLRGSQLPRSGVYLGSIPRTSRGAIRADIVLRNGARRTSYATSWPCA